MNNDKMRFYEFVGFIAACMALNALAIDIMLPALPDLSSDFLLRDPSQVQGVIAVYLLGMGLSQLIYGPLSDRFGRRPVLIGGLLLFSLAGLLSAMANNINVLLAARFVQGMGGGAPRVIAISLARDTYSGRQLGRVMSLAMMIFMAVPILAPSIGQVILTVAPWRWIFGALVTGSALVLLWALLRLRETLPVDRRRAISPGAILEGYRIALTTREAVTYTLALGLVFGCQMGFVISAQFIFADVFGAGSEFGLLFALVASSMALAAFTNSRLVLRFGMRRLALLGLRTMVLLNLVHLALVWHGGESLWLFVLMQAGSMAMFGFLGANLNALAIEPMGHVAGTASSAIGFFTTVAGALLGYGIGQLFNDSALPLTLGYVILGSSALGIISLVGNHESDASPPEPCLEKG